MTTAVLTAVVFITLTLCAGTITTVTFKDPTGQPCACAVFAPVSKVSVTIGTNKVEFVTNVVTYTSNTRTNRVEKK